MKKIALILLMLVFVASCTVKTHFLQTDAVAYEAVSPEQVKIYTGNKLDAEFVVIGSVAADSPSVDGAVKALKEEAGKIGANAVIDVKLAKIASSDSRTGISGVAVRTK